MNVTERNNVRVLGRGTTPMLFAHGYGCDQNMWRYIYPEFEDDYKIILFDHVGAGKSDITSYSTEKYSQLEGYADDILDIIEELNLSNIIFVGHSVSAMMGIIAANKAKNKFKALILVAPSPHYLNSDNYIGGFSKNQIEELLESLENNHLGWSVTMAPVIMGTQNSKSLSDELTKSFCNMDPKIAKEFARTTFLSDSRHDLPAVDLPCLILQCSDDIIAPESVGRYINDNISGSTLVVMNATGHCPNLSAPEETIAAIKDFLK